MIKYEMSKGVLKELEITGTVSELAADVACLYQLIAEKLLEEGTAYFSAFRSTLMGAFDEADNITLKAKLTKLLGGDEKKMEEMHKEVLATIMKAIFGEDMEKYSKEAKAKAYADAEGFNDKSKKGDKK